MQKDKVIERVSSKLHIDYEIAHKVIMHSFEELTKATKVHNSLEISGFGILTLSPTKILKRLPDYKYMVDYFTKRYTDNPNPEDFSRMNEIQVEFDKLKYRYEQIKGTPPVITERNPKL